MPKQAPDFKKQRTKLGKGKQPANNSTNVSFKSKSIGLPSQSILNEIKGEEPRTRKNLTLNSLLIHLKHYSPNMRKDGLLGIRELINNYPQIILLNLSQIIDGIIKLIVDEDSSVRKTLHSFALDLFPRIPKQSWVPFSSILLLFTASGLSHIFPEVRLDSIKFLDILMDFIPESVCQGWAGHSNSSHLTSMGGKQIIDCYTALLNAKGDDKGPAGGSTITTTANAMFTLSMPSRLVVLKSLSKFLKIALSSSEQLTDFPIWPFKSSFSSQEDLYSFASKINKSSYKSLDVQNVKWQEQSGGGNMIWEKYIGEFDNPLTDIGISTTVDEITSATTLLNQTDSHLSQAESDVLSLSRSLYDVIVSVFLESAPSVFMMSNSSVDSLHLESVSSVIEITRELYGFLLRKSRINNDIEKELGVILLHMSKYFPFGGDFIQKQSLEVENQMLQLNILYCELVSCLILSKTSSLNNKGKKKDLKLENKLDIQMESVCNWLGLMLSGNITTASQPLGIIVTAQTYKSLIPSFWALLNLPLYLSAPKIILEAILKHSSQTSVKSETKSLSVEFLSRVYLTQFEISYKGLFTLIKKTEQDKIFTSWFKSLPKLLWEANTNNLKLTEIILDTIQAIIVMDTSDESRKAIGPGLKLFYEAKHPTKGTIPGPWTRISDPSIQKRGIEVAYSAKLDQLPTSNPYWISLQNA